jgi:inward rectifier potassium channel
MSLLRKLNTRAKTQADSGFGTNASDYGGRFINKDGTPNVTKTGLGFFERISWFHTMLAIPGWKFMMFIFLFYIIINLFFAAVYYFLGIEHLGGLITISKWEQFGEAFFFSAQTFTTVGYGRINPTGFMASSIASLEALLGLLSLALATGLLYGRFSRPRAYIRFSENALVAPYKEIAGLMVRLAPFKNISLSNVEAKITIGMRLEENGKMVNRFFSLDLEMEKVNALSLSWTLVHPINESSPIYQFTPEDFNNITGEILVFIRAFDDMFSNTVIARTSYTFKEVIVGAKFLPMYHQNASMQKTVLDMEKLNLYIPSELPLMAAAPIREINA